MGSMFVSSKSARKRSHSRPATVMTRYSDDEIDDTVELLGPQRTHETDVKFKLVEENQQSTSPTSNPVPCPQ